MPLRGAPEPLRARALRVLLPLRFPEAIADALFAVRAHPETDHAHPEAGSNRIAPASGTT